MPAAVLGGAAIVGAVSSDRAASKAAKATKNAADKSTALQQAQFERGLQEVAPFRQAGVGALAALSSAANEPVQQFSYRDPAAFLNEYWSSPEFQALNSQATDQILRSSSATGGLRSGDANAALARSAPLLGIDALQRMNQQDVTAFGINQGAISDRFNRLYGLSSMGANVASGNQTAGMNFASSAGQNAMMAGNAQANAYGQRANAIGGLASDLGSVYLGNRMGLFDRTSAGKI